MGTGTLLVCLICLHSVSSSPLTENESYFESVYGKKCLQDSDCAPVSYCDAFSGKSISEITGDFECKIQVWLYLVVGIIALVIFSSLCSCLCCPCCCIYKCVKSCCCC